MRSGKVNPALLGVAGFLLVAVIVYWVFFSGPGAPPPPPPPENQPDVSLYHRKTGDTLIIPRVEFDQLAVEDGIYEYPAGSGKFNYRRSKPGGIRIIDP